MKQLTFIKAKRLAWWDVPEPTLRSPLEALVRPFVAARCDGDAMFLRHDFERLLRVGAALHVVDPAFANARDDVFHGPFAYGHECVAEVVAVGEAVRQHAVGDVVIVPFIAERLGARPLQVKKVRLRRSKWPRLSDTYPIAVDASGTTSGLELALSALAAGGSCTALAFYLRRGTPLPLWNMYLKSTTLHVGVSHPRVHLPGVLDLVSSGRFDPMKLRPTIGSWADADRILLEPATKVIVQRERIFSGHAVEFQHR